METLDQYMLTVIRNELLLLLRSNRNWIQNSTQFRTVCGLSSFDAKPLILLLYVDLSRATSQQKYQNEHIIILYLCTAIVIHRLKQTRLPFSFFFFFCIDIFNLKKIDFKEKKEVGRAQNHISQSFIFVGIISICSSARYGVASAG